MRQLALALGASIALHAAAFVALPRQGLETRPALAVRLPAAVDVEISLAGGVAPEAARKVGHTLPRLRGPAVAESLPPAHRRVREGGRRLRAAPSASATATATANANATPTGMPTANPTAMPTPDPGGAGGLSLSDLDLTAFFDRLERAAQRCAGPRSGEGRVRFCVDSDGAPIDVSLVQTTGNFALDDAALHCVIPGAAPFPRTSRCLVVPLAFH